MGFERNGAGYHHTPVMLEEVLEILQPAPGKVAVDATLGGGGHAEALLKRLHPGGRLLGIDCDEDALAAASKRLASFGDSFRPIRGNFSALKEIVERFEPLGVDCLLFDLGVSSFQLDCEERGFSYQKDTPLDMRMDQQLPQTAADLLNELSENELQKIFRTYGQEKWSGRIASFIVNRRREKGPIKMSGELVETVKAAVPAAARRKGGHPARRIFQALRIAVNRELENLREGLRQGISILRPTGRMAVIAYHSLEDEIVKRAFIENSRGCICPPKLPRCSCGRVPVVKIISKKPCFPSTEEIEANPRARSARLRAAEKIDPHTNDL